MNVRQLIAHLNTMPADAYVGIYVLPVPAGQRTRRIRQVRTMTTSPHDNTKSHTTVEIVV